MHFTNRNNWTIRRTGQVRSYRRSQSAENPAGEMELNFARSTSYRFPRGEKQAGYKDRPSEIGFALQINLTAERENHPMGGMCMRFARAVFAVLVALLILHSQSLHAQAGVPPDIDGFVQRVLREFEVPGIALAIVKDGKVVLSRGYGVRTLGSADRVDEGTLFAIASNTKAFTATAIAILVEEGKLSWDTPVVQYLPWFALADPYVTREITVRDLLVHRSGLGLGAGDLLWWPPSTYSRNEIARRLRFIPLAKSFRSAYAYDNVLYTVAGELIESVSGMSWEDFVSSRVLAKVGMRSSTVRHWAMGSRGDFASPHAPIDGTVQIVKPFASDNLNPQGGINSCADDMAKWLIVQLDSGRVSDGSRLFSPRTTRELWSLVTPMPIRQLPPDLAPRQRNFNGYALGFDVYDYCGYKVVSHTGGLPGYVSKVTMIPALKLGVVVLTNQESGDAFEAITNHVVDSYLGAPAVDWIRVLSTIASRRRSIVASADAGEWGTRDSLSHSSLPLERYAGTYVDAWYGPVDVGVEGGNLIMRFSHTPALVGDMTHWQYDTFLVRWKERELRADALVTFSLNAEGKIAEVRMKPASATTDFSFDFQDLLLRPQIGPERGR